MTASRANLKITIIKHSSTVRNYTHNYSKLSEFTIVYYIHFSIVNYIRIVYYIHFSIVNYGLIQYIFSRALSADDQNDIEIVDYISL